MFALCDLIIFYIEKQDLEDLNFTIFYKVVSILNDSKSKDFYPKKILFFVDKLYDLEQFLILYEHFKQNLRESWNDFLNKV